MTSHMFPRNLVFTSSTPPLFPTLPSNLSLSWILELATTAKAFQVKPELLEKALTERTVRDNSRGGRNVTTPISNEQATFSRDALAKSTYDRLFTWIVKKINDNIYSRESGTKAIIGVLDIYGFEILEVNYSASFPLALL